MMQIDVQDLVFSYGGADVLQGVSFCADKGERIAVLGPNGVGKSTLFNALTNAGAESANYPFCTIEKNVGIVSVPDARLDKLAEMYEPDKFTPATLEFVDIAGLVKGLTEVGTDVQKAE